MDRRFGGRGWILVLLALAGAAAVGFASYNAGVAHGLAEAARASGTPGLVPPYGYMWRPWGFGFGLLPFLFVLLWFLALRSLFWCGPRRGWDRPGGQGPAPQADR